MKRWFLAVAVLLSGAISLAYADYIIIRINLGATRGVNPAAVPGGNPGGPLPGAGGGAPAGGAPGMEGMEGMDNSFPQGRMPMPPMGEGNPMPPMGEGAPDDENVVVELVETTPLYIMAFVEVKIDGEARAYMKQTGFPFNQLIAMGVGRVQHPWGKANLIADQRNLEIFTVGLPTVEGRYEARRKKLLLKDKSPAKLLEEAEWTLTHHLLDKFEGYMDELAKWKSDDPKISAAVKAYQQIKADLDRSVTKDDAAIAWKDKLGYKVYQEGHYALIYDEAKPKVPPDILFCRSRLEKNLRAFYYWWALNGRILPVPDRRLVAVMLNKPDEFVKYHKTFDSVPLVADGFYAKRDNLAVFSPIPRDESYNALSKFTRELWRNHDVGELLQGRGLKKGIHPAEVSYAQTMALMQKALEEEAELMTVTHEGTRQLAAVAGLLPRSVIVPEWVQFGLGSFFETSKGAFWPSIGTPNWNYLPQYKILRQDRKLDRPEQALERVVTDYYFRHTAGGKDRMAVLKARTLAWALTYYLFQEKREGMLRYYQELSHLPRDLEFDADVLLGCFARAFDLAAPAQPRGVDMAKLQTLAREWDKYIASQRLPDLTEPLEWALQDLVKAQNERRMPVKPEGKDKPPPGKPPAGG